MTAGRDRNSLGSLTMIPEAQVAHLLNIISPRTTRLGSSVRPYAKNTRHTPVRSPTPYHSEPSVLPSFATSASRTRSVTRPYEIRNASLRRPYDCGPSSDGPLRDRRARPDQRLVGYSAHLVVRSGTACCTALRNGTRPVWRRDELVDKCQARGDWWECVEWKQCAITCHPWLQPFLSCASLLRFLLGNPLCPLFCKGFSVYFQMAKRTVVLLKAL